MSNASLIGRLAQSQWILTVGTRVQPEEPCSSMLGQPMLASRAEPPSERAQSVCGFAQVLPRPGTNRVWGISGVTMHIELGTEDGEFRDLNTLWQTEVIPTAGPHVRLDTVEGEAVCRPLGFSNIESRG